MLITRRCRIETDLGHILVKTSFEAEVGTSATVERQDPASYELDVRLRVKVPQPHNDLDGLLKLNRRSISFIG